MFAGVPFGLSRMSDMVSSDIVLLLFSLQIGTFFKLGADRTLKFDELVFSEPSRGFFNISYVVVRGRAL